MAIYSEQNVKGLDRENSRTRLRSDIPLLPPVFIAN
ncbi:MAG: hypothetical protein QOI10_3788 [Solirubrobacterales bacterium]|jgi:hypothetical protein|nr:hypothetical protein [Solirubrobacterales bacterium]